MTKLSFVYCEKALPVLQDGTGQQPYVLSV